MKYLIESIDVFTSYKYFISQIREIQGKIKELPSKEKKYLKRCIYFKIKEREDSFNILKNLYKIGYKPIPDNWKSVIIDSKVSFNPFKPSIHAV